MPACVPSTHLVRCAGVQAANANRLIPPQRTPCVLYREVFRHVFAILHAHLGELLAILPSSTWPNLRPFSNEYVNSAVALLSRYFPARHGSVTTCHHAPETGAAAFKNSTRQLRIPCPQVLESRQRTHLTSTIRGSLTYHPSGPSPDDRTDTRDRIGPKPPSSKCRSRGQGDLWKIM